MKRTLLIIIAAMAAFVPVIAQGRTVEVSITDTKGKPVNGLEAYGYVKGVKEISILEPGQAIPMSGIESGDVIAVLIGNTIYEIPVEGASSVRIVMKNKRKITGYSLDGGETVIKDMVSYPAESEDWVRGAVDLATSYHYNDLKDYIESRIASLTPVMTPTGWQLVIRGNGGKPALIVVDGVTYSNFDSVNAFIKPWHVKSIEVDRLGTIYGIRGQNGVVNITTRKE